MEPGVLIAPLEIKTADNNTYYVSGWRTISVKIAKGKIVVKGLTLQKHDD